MDPPKWVYEDIKNKRAQIDELKELLDQSRTPSERSSRQKQIDVTETLIRNLRNLYNVPDPQASRRPPFKMRP
jgi:hypothetical protein